MIHIFFWKSLASTGVSGDDCLPGRWWPPRWGGRSHVHTCRQMLIMETLSSTASRSSLAQELRGEQTSSQNRLRDRIRIDHNALPRLELLQGHPSEPSELCHGRIHLPSRASEPRSSALWYHHGRTSKCPWTRHCRRVQIRTCQGLEWKAPPSYHWNWSSGAGSEWYLWTKCHAGAVSRHEVCGTFDHHWT